MKKTEGTKRANLWLWICYQSACSNKLCPFPGEVPSSSPLLCIHIISWLCKCTAKPVHLKMKIKIKHRTKLVHKVFVSSVCHSTMKSLLVLNWGGQCLSMRVSKSLDSGSRWSSSFLLHPFPAQHTLAVQLTFLWDSPRLSHIIPGFVIVKFQIKL